MTSRTEHTLLVVDTDGRELHRVGDVDAVRPIASVGKLLLRPPARVILVRP